MWKTLNNRFKKGVLGIAYYVEKSISIFFVCLLKVFNSILTVNVCGNVNNET